MHTTKFLDKYGVHGDIYSRRIKIWYVLQMLQHIISTVVVFICKYRNLKPKVYTYMIDIMAI